MHPKPVDSQDRLFESRLDRICNPDHAMIKLANQIDWSEFENAFGPLYSPDRGCPGKPIRLIVGLHYLKHAFDLSDEAVVEQWVENPYWQYFCGQTHFQHQLTIHPTLMTKWRNKVKAEGLEKLLEVTITTGLKTGVIKKHQLNKVSVDTTVQPKAITYPTDAKLYYRMRERLVRQAQKQGIELRQNYRRKAKTALVSQGRYAHARQMKRARRETKRLKTYLGRVFRDISRKAAHDAQQKTEALTDLLVLADRLLQQQRHDKNKLYSVHAPEVECIAKGKAHQKYEFGCKVSVVATMKDPFILGMQAIHGNPYDGHTLSTSLEQAERLASFSVKEAYVDRGYRGHDYKGEGVIHLARRGMKKLKRTIRKWLNQRSAIEAVIGHNKTDGRLDRNYLKGQEGDRMNAILSGCGYNIRKLLRKLIFWLLGVRSWATQRAFGCSVAA